MKELLTKEQNDHNRAAWAKHVQDRAEGHTEYHLLMTLLRERDVFKAYKPLTNKKKIEAHYGKFYTTLEHAIWALQSAFRFLNNVREYKTTSKYYADKELDQLPLTWHQWVKDAQSVSRQEMFCSGFLWIPENVQHEIESKLTLLQDIIKEKYQAVV